MVSSWLSGLGSLNNRFGYRRNLSFGAYLSWSSNTLLLHCARSITLLNMQYKLIYLISSTWVFCLIPYALPFRASHFARAIPRKPYPQCAQFLRYQMLANYCSLFAGIMQDNAMSNKGKREKGNKYYKRVSRTVPPMWMETDRSPEEKSHKPCPGPS